MQSTRQAQPAPAGRSAAATRPARPRSPAAPGRMSCACGGGCPRCRGGLPAAVQAVRDTPGRPLDDATRRRFEPRFGHDFGQVRLHTGVAAERAAASVGAVAYTLGSDIVFGRAGPAPGVLAHELAHVVQQRGARPSAEPALGEAGDAHERAADAAAAAVLVGRSAPPSAAAPLAVQRLQRQTDAGFERSSGVGPALASGTMTAVAGVHGAHFTAAGCFGRSGCDIDMQFQKAYRGDFAYRAAGGRDVRGVYVKIVASYPENCWHCQPLELVQVIRNITKSSTGTMVTADPGTATRRERSGWDTADAPSRGWRIDRVADATDPVFTHGHNGNPGGDGRPAVLWDAPGDWATGRNVGKEFQTFAMCGMGGRMIPMASVTWGYYTDAAGVTSFRPATPAVQCGTSTELTDATTRWNAISGNTALGLGTGAPPSALGDYPTPSEDVRRTA